MSTASTPRILFSQQREDPTIEESILSLIHKKTSSEDIQILTVASGGCTCFSLLDEKKTISKHIGRIDATDLNIAQIHLCLLKLNLLLEDSLDWKKRVQFLQGGEDALIMYSDLSKLSSDTKSFWDGRTDEIKFGVGRSGNYEELFRELSNQICHTQSQINPENDQSIRSNWDEWMKGFEKCFSNDNLIRLFGENAVKFSTSSTFAQHFASVFFEAAKNYGNEFQSKHQSRNYFLDSIWKDCYVETNVPEYLKEDYRLSLATASKLHFSVGDLRKVLAEAVKVSKKYHLIVTSNLTDWMSIEDVEKMLQDASRCLYSGGAILCRRLNGDYKLEELVGKYFKTDTEVNKRIKSEDKSFFYSEVVVGWSVQ